VHWELQRAALKAAEEERHRVQLELGDRRQGVEKLRAKYETLAKSFAGAGTGEVNGVDGVGGGCSQAYYIIAAAQKREELQREGDELDQEIRKSEREIRALENTLQHLNARNVDFRVSFQKADMGSTEARALSKLEGQAKIAKDALFRRKKDLQRVQTDLEEDTARLEGVQARVAHVEEQNGHLRTACGQVDGELAEQKEILAQVQEKLKTLRKTHRNGSSSTDSEDNVRLKRETLTEKAFRTGALRDTASGVLYTLGQLAKEFPEMHDALHTLLQKRGLRVPNAPPGHGPASRNSRSSRLARQEGSRPPSARSDAVASSHSSRSSGGSQGGGHG
ncbi:unnamed protein product, partial [Choristocarpus tenellus]